MHLTAFTAYVMSCTSMGTQLKLSFYHSLICTVHFALSSCIVIGWGSTCLIFTQCRITCLCTALFLFQVIQHYGKNQTRQNGFNMLNSACIWKVTMQMNVFFYSASAGVFGFSSRCIIKKLSAKMLHLCILTVTHLQMILHQ